MECRKLMKSLAVTIWCDGVKPKTENKLNDAYIMPLTKENKSIVNIPKGYGLIKQSNLL